MTDWEPFRSSLLAELVDRQLLDLPPPTSPDAVDFLAGQLVESFHSAADLHLARSGRRPPGSLRLPHWSVF